MNAIQLKKIRSYGLWISVTVIACVPTLGFSFQAPATGLDPQEVEDITKQINDSEHWKVMRVTPSDNEDTKHSKDTTRNHIEYQFRVFNPDEGRIKDIIIDINNPNLNSLK